MKKTILITLCCASLMLVTPFTTVAQENKVSSNLPNESEIDGLVVQIRTVVDEILQKYGHNPIVSNLCNLIFDLIWFPGKLIICAVLFNISMFIMLLWLYAWQIFGLGNLLFSLGFAIFFLYLMIGCDPTWPYSPLKLISNLNETKDITNLAKDCPCLQE